MKKITLFLLLVAFAGMANATVYYVSASGNNTTGTSWETAFTSPAAALASANLVTNPFPVAGDEVWVKQGTYVSATQLTWKTGINFYGGFVGTETSRSQRSTDASLTILEGNNTNRVLNAPAMASPTTWDGFTIQKGTATTGAGAFLQKNAILSNCIFQNNTAANAVSTYVAAGGGVYIQGTSGDTDSIKVLNCTIKNNIVKTVAVASNYCGGGGIYVKAGSIKAVIRGCTIESNTADGLGTANAIVSGGGIYLCDGIVDACTVKNNTVTNANPSTSALTYAKNQGGGIFIMPQTTTNTLLQNSTITGNSAPTYVGGGIAIDPLYSSSVITGKVSILNTFITNNSTRGAGGGVITNALNTASTSEYLFNNCVIANNESSTVAAGGGGVFVNNILGTNVSPIVNNSVKFTNCTVVNNKMLTTNYGGAGIFYNFISADITNCVFWGNGSVGVINPYHVRVKTTLTTNKITNCVFDNRFVESEVSPVATPADLTGKVIVDVANTGSTGGTLYANFVSPTNFVGKVVSGADQTSFNAANWSVTHASACVNNGATIAGITTDIAGLTRPQAGAYDIGAYELRAYTITASANNGTMGSVSGAGSKVTGSTAALVANANSGYSFINWTENGSSVSTNASYSFTVAANKTLVANFVANAVSVASTQNASALTLTPASQITVAAGGTLVLDANTTLNSLSVAPGAKVTLADTKTLTANSITLQSSVDGTATFVDENTAEIPAAVVGTVQQHIAATNRNWYTSIPVTAANVESLSSANAVGYWDEPNGMFKTLTALSPLNPLRGYISAATTSLTYTGTFNSGPKSIVLTHTPGKNKEGFNLIGNPYPSYLDWSMVDTTATNITTSIWYRTKTSGGAYAFDTYNRKSNVGTTNGENTVTNLIPPMQAFWVRAKTNGGTLTITNAMRKHADVAGNKLKVPAHANSIQKLVRLKVSNGTNSDETILLFNPNASDGYDDYDSPKMTNDVASVPEIFTVAGGEELVINGLKELTPTKEVALGFYSGAASTQSFTLKATEISNFETGTRIIIKDNLVANSEVDITDGQAVTFVSGAAKDANRFSVIFRAPGVTTGVDNSAKLNAQVYVNVANHITILATEKSNYAIYNAMGQLIENGVLNTKRETRNAKHLAAGVYVVKVNNQSTRVIIK